MCTRLQRCPVLEFDELVTVTMRLAADPRWRWLQPVCARGTPPGVDGQCLGRKIRYAAAAPVCVVPHELAHLATGERAHGPRWTAAYVEFSRWLGAAV